MDPSGIGKTAVSGDQRQVGLKLQKIAKRMNGDGCARHGNIERNRIYRWRVCVEATMSQYDALTSLFV